LGRKQQDASRSVSDSETATVVLSIHPLRGQKLRVVRVCRAVQHAPGVRHLDLVNARGQVVRVPAAWTDWALPHEALPETSNSRSSCEGLLTLATLVEALDGRKLDTTDPVATMRTSGQMRRLDGEEQAANAGGVLGGSRSADPGHGTRHTGKRAAASSSRRRRERGAP
jgi:hypothetical protein